MLKINKEHAERVEADRKLRDEREHEFKMKHGHNWSYHIGSGIAWGLFWIALAIGGVSL